MPTKRYKSTLTEQIIELEIPDKLDLKGEISFRDYKSKENSGMFGFELSGETLIITDIWTPGGLKITDLFILEAINYYKMHGLNVTSVIADRVIQSARGFYLQNGFLPTTSNMEMNNKYVPPPDSDEINFAAHFFHTRILGGDIYETKNSEGELRSVTRNGFDMRIEAGRNAPHWKMSDSFLEKLVQQKSSLIWKEDVTASTESLNRVPTSSIASNLDGFTRTLNTRITPTSKSNDNKNDINEGVALDSPKNYSMKRK
ncbi:hypothetical protein OOZ15_19330 [Galbibacter sp. EGI 63066]|uniref:hypothetical protein n=1 Tax=Galbibacter sp. EGI 63066 TaxID=2993559 RepID=UPI0022489AFD|nr:hypothetical protein [Galbibacter sp. EGI 63066]MCX2682111.1 hypothetical protein [Galbibacter sp. EGI 63066]